MPHISYSELKIWKECAWKHKLEYIDGLRSFRGNEFTAFGTALHTLCEEQVKGNLTEGFSDVFDHEFLKELQKLPKDLELRQDLIASMRDQGKVLAPMVMPYLRKHFGDFTLVSTEEKLMEAITSEHFPDKKYNFKGFIDLVLKTDDGKYHVIDWKTCSWGWDAKKKADKMTCYQLVLYKNFFAQKHGIDPKDIDTHFALLKRTAKSNQIEIFRVTSGQKRIKNSLDMLEASVYNIINKNYIKNRLACQRCPYYKTEHCT
tara:strand:+ start:5850 stop:6629 length:780 start_codon:yes stop_codon:yes gene_type:complete